MTAIGEALAATLRAERAAQRLTYAELSELSGVTVTSLQRYLFAKRDISVDQLYAIAHAFGLLTSEIVRRAEDRMSGAAKQRVVQIEDWRR